MKLLYSLSVIYLVLQVAVGQTCPSGVDIKSPEDTDLLAEFYENGRTTQVVPPPGTTIDVILFSFRLQELSSAHPIILKTSIFFDPIATYSVIRCEGFFYATDVVIPSHQFQFIVQGSDSTGLEILFIAGPHFQVTTPEPVTTEPATTEPVTSKPTSQPETPEPETEAPDPETPEPVTSEPETSRLFTLTEDRVRPENLTIFRRRSARIVLNFTSSLSANRTRFIVGASSSGLVLRIRPRRFVQEPGSSRNIILRMRAVRRTRLGFHPVVVEVLSLSSDQDVIYSNRVIVLGTQEATEAPIPTDVPSVIPTAPPLLESFPCDECLNGGSCFVQPEIIPGGLGLLELGCICTPEYTGSTCETRLSVA